MTLWHRKRFVAELMMSLYDSSLAHLHLQDLILAFILKTLKAPSYAADLVSKAGKYQPLSVETHFGSRSDFVSFCKAPMLFAVSLQVSGKDALILLNSEVICR